MQLDVRITELHAKNHDSSAARRILSGRVRRIALPITVMGNGSDGLAFRHDTELFRRFGRSHLAGDGV